MANKLFSEDDIAFLLDNPYVKNVTTNNITYTNEFRQLFLAENSNGKLPRQIFKECGFDVDMIGIKRIESSGKRWRDKYRRLGIDGLVDHRKDNSGRPKANLSPEEKYKKLEAENKMLKAENELLKKLEQLERKMIRKKY